jgi:hypothetical protein
MEVSFPGMRKTTKSTYLVDKNLRFEFGYIEIPTKNPREISNRQSAI